MGNEKGIEVGKEALKNKERLPVAIESGIRQSLLEYANISIRQQSGCIEECLIRRKNWICAEDSSFNSISISDIHHQKEDTSTRICLCLD